LAESEISARSAKLVELDQKAWFAHAATTCDALRKIRVAVIGGGFAGMTAAWSLWRREKAIEIVLFEAGDHVGGRVLTSSDFAVGRIIEFGAELIGANHARWIHLARELGVGLMTRTGEDHYALMGLEMVHKVDGRDIDIRYGLRLTGLLKDVLKEIGKDAKQVEEPAAPWRDPANQKFDNMSVDDKLTGKRPAGLGLPRNDIRYLELKILLENDLCIRLDRISYLGLLCLVKAHRFGSDDPDADPILHDKDTDLLGFWEHTEDFRCTDGCQNLARKMLLQLTDPKNYNFTLLVNTKVNKITFDLTAPIKPRPAKLEWKTGNPRARGMDANFDYVILAVPPTVWDDIAITPEHPKDKTGPLQGGPAIKFFSALANRFWIREGKAPSGISSDIGMIWEGTDNQALAEAYNKYGRKMTQELVLSVYAGSPGYTGRSDKKLQGELARIYNGYVQSNQGRKIHLQEWHKVENIKIGLSCPKPGQIFKAGALLQAPFDGGRLFLAGEHTQTDFFGFMEGALRSGESAANALIAEVCPRPITA
jgi:monoamine oxidase